VCVEDTFLCAYVECVYSQRTKHIEEYRAGRVRHARSPSCSINVHTRRVSRLVSGMAAPMVLLSSSTSAV
jgi:hypothetical protein